MEEKEFESDIYDVSVWKKVFVLLWEHKKIVICNLILNVLLACTDVILPLFNRFAIDTYVVEQTQADTLFVFAICYGILIMDSYIKKIKNVPVLNSPCNAIYTPDMIINSI